MSAGPTVLVVDDDPDVTSWLVEALSSEERGFEARGETSALRAIEWIREHHVDIVISDVEMPELRGPDLLRLIHEVRPNQLVLLITAFGSIDLAVESVRAGAADFLAKPFRIEALVLALQRALRERELRREIVRLRRAATERNGSGICARSVAMKKVLDLAQRVAKSDLPVLITGESGVGKGVVARYIHEHSDRSGAKIVQLNCAALPAGIAEAELFGVRRGAFTDAREDRAGVFEQAHRGTLFLDEIGELPLELQPKLLQALESNRVRPLGASGEVPAEARVIAATNRPLEAAVRDQRFRDDLYHRLNVLRIDVPPLRERPEDIDPIVDQVLENIAARSGRAPWGVSKAAMRWIRSYPWPGNVRELIHAIERGVVFAEHDVLTLEDVIPEAARADREASFLADAVRDRFSLAELEREYIRRVLAETDGHKGKAAMILGLDRRTLYRKIAEMEEGSGARPRGAKKD
ncbi:MAG TPA: sigma-54 dependent transcriptional regulator [Polyangiaceae bacterium]|nr:sigma-54 dependent transcriptional regulator [Polyangiaceae bacterium]